MPGPPPPPPPPGCPPLPAFNAVAPSKAGDLRGALLQSIRKGTTLNKTVTNDRSGPTLGKQASSSNSASRGNSGPLTNGAGLGGLFAGGIPKLKPVGKQSGDTNETNNYSLHPQKYSNDVQSELKKQMASHSNRNRGPPPPAPTRQISQSTEHLQREAYHSRSESGSNGLHLSVNNLHRTSNSPGANNCGGGLQPNSSTLHRKATSSANLSSYDATDGGLTGTTLMRKPNLAPKPLALNGKPSATPKRLNGGRPSNLHRAQSMKSPRTPSPQSPEDFPNRFGTVRNMSAVLDKSLTLKPRPLINGRPTAPPPLVPVHQNHASKMMKAPSDAPPPPPPGVAPPQPPTHAPPPPPQRGNYQTAGRTPPLVPNSSAPPPPPRHSSMRDLNGMRTSLDLDYKFRKEFHPSSEFPPPGSFRSLAKSYTQQESAC